MELVNLLQRCEQCNSRRCLILILEPLMRKPGSLELQHMSDLAQFSPEMLSQIQLRLGCPGRCCHVIKERRERIYLAVCVWDCCPWQLITNSSPGFQQGFDVILAGSSAITTTTSCNPEELSAPSRNWLRMHSHTLAFFSSAVSYQRILSPFHLINNCFSATEFYKMFPPA